MTRLGDQEDLALSPLLHSDEAMRSLAALAVLSLAIPAAAETISGTPTIIDGDTVEISGKRIRLFGIDAPEVSQTCIRDGAAWACGEASKDRLRALIGDNPISCSGFEHDMHARLLATCRLSGADLNQAMVAEGWATAFRRYSEAYVADEMRARAKKLGLWSSNFVPPQEYRDAIQDNGAAALQSRGPERSTVNQYADPQCRIKGNRNSRGEWIYHLPGMKYYAETRAEEMFCTESQARAAGYRKSRARW